MYDVKNKLSLFSKSNNPKVYIVQDTIVSRLKRVGLKVFVLNKLQSNDITIAVPFKTDIEMRTELSCPTQDPINTAIIQNFINTVKGADAGLAKEVKLTILTGKRTCIYIRHSNGKTTRRYGKIC